MGQKLNKRVALVTGSTKGIGQSIAQKLAADGMAVVVTSRTKEGAQRAAESINSAGGEALGLKFNIEERQDLTAVLEATLEAFGRLDVLVNNALSTSSAMPVDTLTDEQIEFAFTSNITHTFLLSRATYPHLKETGGSVINIGSVVVNRHFLGIPMYGIIKAAVLQMTKILSAEWAADGITVNAINPGFIRTSAFSDFGMPEELVKKSYDFYRDYHSLGRVGEPADVGKMAAYLASEAGSFITGAVIEVDGGLSTKGLPMYMGE